MAHRPGAAQGNGVLETLWRKLARDVFDCRVEGAKFKMRTMKIHDLKSRTKGFALQVIKFCDNLPKEETCKTLGAQLLRSGTSVGANYRAVCRAKSTADHISKFGTVLEEADESAFWIELLVDAGKIRADCAGALLSEAKELVTISISSIIIYITGIKGFTNFSLFSEVTIKSVRRILYRIICSFWKDLNINCYKRANSQTQTSLDR